MNRCPSCASLIPDEQLACPSCGAETSQPETQLLTGAEQPATGGNGGGAARKIEPAVIASVKADSLDRARFIPGTMLQAERYRIVGLLGRGGMGEVYKAEDLKLEQLVALKFLPEALAADGAALARLHREVRVARQISHRNVCRVYDIGEAGGLPFLSMELIRGEELAATLKRIGRLPADKAVEVARQLCAGLAAAHEAGVLHRDLKPANVMLDERGNVRILDFGLAGLAEEFRGGEIASGTPAYMAPEQLAGQEVTAQSDIYALGLVLYEIFTGKRVFDARTLDELLRQRQSDATPTSPTSLVKELDPLVERVIERCLASDPAERPASALQVAAALPGGDPLAAALAAGETPSPEMVAAAPKEGVLRPAVAVSLLAALFALTAAMLYLSRDAALYRLVPLEKSPEVLRERARGIISELGYTTPPVDTAEGLSVTWAYPRHLLQNDPSPARWDKLKVGQPAVFEFWYRESPRYLLPAGEIGDLDFDNPPRNVSGMTSVLLDTGGRLVSFSYVPPQVDNAPEPQQPRQSAADWAKLFAAAGLDPALFTTTAPRWNPPTYADERAAWEGVYPDQTNIKLRVEAAAYRGRPVYFTLLSPWDVPGHQVEETLSKSETISFIILLSIFFATLVGGIVLAVRNLRQGRGDRRGALRLSLFLLAAFMFNWIFSARHVLGFAEFNSFLHYFQSSLFFTGFIWLTYIALEPFVRRRWPNRIVSWTRLLGGGWRDPLVGRDILIGSVFGAGLIVHHYFFQLLPTWLGRPSDIPHFNPAGKLLGLSSFASGFTHQIFGTLLVAFCFLFVLLLIRLVLRRERLTFVVGFALLIVIGIGNTPDQPLNLFSTLINALLVIGVLYRFGLLAFVAALFFHHLWLSFPITSDFAAWYAGGFVLALMISLALACYGFYTSLAGQPLFRRGLLDD